MYGVYCAVLPKFLPLHTLFRDHKPMSDRLLAEWSVVFLEKWLYMYILAPHSYSLVVCSCVLLEKSAVIKFVGWGETESTWYTYHSWACCTSRASWWWWGWIWWQTDVWSRWRNENWHGNPKYSEKACPRTTSSTTNLTWSDLVSSTGRHGGKLRVNRSSHGTSQATQPLRKSRTSAEFYLVLKNPPRIILSQIIQSHCPYPVSIMSIRLYWHVT
jgi:hypothetical protein